MKVLVSMRKNGVIMVCGQKWTKVEKRRLAEWKAVMLENRCKESSCVRCIVVAE